MAKASEPLKAKVPGSDLSQTSILTNWPPSGEEEMGRVSMDGGYDELLGVPDHPRFNKAEEEKEVKPAGNYCI